MPPVHTRDWLTWGLSPSSWPATIEAVMGPATGALAVSEVSRSPISRNAKTCRTISPGRNFRTAANRLYHPAGCRECRRLGFAGRQGIFELCATTDEVRQLAHDRASSWEIRQAALKGGMRTLREDAWLKVFEGHNHRGGSAASDQGRPNLGHLRKSALRMRR